MRIANCELRIVLAIAFPVLLGSNEGAIASSTRCREIQQARRIAIAEGLDDRNLAILEARYCGIIRRDRHPTPSQTSHCAYLGIMAKLARIAEGYSELARMVASEEQITCRGLYRDRSPWQYPNGQRVKFGSQWYYPNGQSPRTGQDWRYPNGQYARFGLVWKYPNGQNAKTGNLWYKPDGTLVQLEELVSWGCTYVSRYECDRILIDIRSRDEVRRNLAILELAWQGFRY